MRQVSVVLVQVAGIQRYIFDTNKRRENVGGSELVHRLSREWFDKALVDLRLRSGPIEGAQVEKLVGTAGWVLALVDDVATGRALLTSLTSRALREAPGLDVCGVIVGPFDWDDPGEPGDPPAARVVREAHEQLPAARSARPGPDLRFLRLPPVSECATSGMPAAGLFKGGDNQPRSAASLARLRAFAPSVERLADEIGTDPETIELLIDYLGRGEEDVETEGSDAHRPNWVAVVHADGNSVGQLFFDFGHLCAQVRSGTSPNPNRAYASGLTEFTAGLERCTLAAFRSALASAGEVEVAEDTHVVPVLPLVLGGDDLTVVCEATSALPFTVAFLAEFENQTSQDPSVSAFVRAKTNVPWLSACAGVSLVKPHFPFASAYGLADELLKSAKQVKQHVSSPCSAVDFHVHHDPSGGSLDRIRSLLSVDDQGKTHLWGGPYVVTPPDRLPGDEQWWDNHRWDTLVARASALRAKDPETGRTRIPGAQTHALREALFQGKLVAEGRYRDLLSRFPGVGLEAFDTGSKSHFWDIDGSPTTSFLDAMDLAPFLGRLDRTAAGRSAG